MPKYEVELQFEGMLITVEAGNEEEARADAMVLCNQRGGPNFESVEAYLVEDDDAQVQS